MFNVSVTTSFMALLELGVQMSRMTGFVLEKHETMQLTF